MYPAPSSPWSVHPNTNSHPKLETGTPCSRDPLGPGQAARPSPSTGWATPSSLPASLPPECPGLSQQGPAVWECPGSVAQPPCPATAVWECPRSVGSVAQPPLSCGNAPGVWHSPPVLQPPRGCQGPPGHSGIGLGSHQLFTLLALVLVLSHMLGLAGFGFPVGFGWLGPGFSAPTFLRALSPPWPFRSVRGELERADLGKGNPAHVR